LIAALNPPRCPVSSGRTLEPRSRIELNSPKTRQIPARIVAYLQMKPILKNLDLRALDGPIPTGTTLRCRERARLPVFEFASKYQILPRMAHIERCGLRAILSGAFQCLYRSNLGSLRMMDTHSGNQVCGFPSKNDREISAPRRQSSWSTSFAVSAFLRSDRPRYRRFRALSRLQP